MLQEAKVSVIVPIYNVEKYLDRCVSSILNQTLKDLEIILVDDGSPDNCPAMCDEYAKNDSRVKVIHKKNAGQGLARNSGLEIATGKYVAFIDSDDYVDESMYESMYALAENESLDLCCCSYNRFYNDGHVVAAKWYNKPKIVAGQRQVNQLILDLNIKNANTIIETNVWGVLYSKDIIDKNRIRFVSEREIASEDLIFNYDFFIHANKIAYTPNRYYNYYYNDNSTTTNYGTAKYKRMVQLLYSLDNRLSNRFTAQEYEPYFCYSVLRIFKIILKFEVLRAKSLKEGLASLKNALTEPIFKRMLTSVEFRKSLSTYNKILISCFDCNNFLTLYFIQSLKLKLKK